MAAPCIKYNQSNTPYIEFGAYEIRLENEQPDEAVLQKSRDELREVPEIVEPAILELRELVKGKQRRNYIIGEFVTVMHYSKSRFSVDVELTVTCTHEILVSVGAVDALTNNPKNIRDLRITCMLY